MTFDLIDERIEDTSTFPDTNSIRDIAMKVFDATHAKRSVVA